MILGIAVGRLLKRWRRSNMLRLDNMFNVGMDAALGNPLAAQGSEDRKNADYFRSMPWNPDGVGYEHMGELVHTGSYEPRAYFEPAPRELRPVEPSAVPGMNWMGQGYLHKLF